jgi:hypothetical protein
MKRTFVVLNSTLARKTRADRPLWKLVDGGSIEHKVTGERLSLRDAQRG